jgi:hypothetical protein
MASGGNNDKKSHQAGSLNSQGDAASLPSMPLRHSTAASVNRSSNVSQADLKLAVKDELLGSMAESDQLATSTPVSLEIIQDIKRRLPTWLTGLNEPGCGQGENTCLVRPSVTLMTPLVIYLTMTSCSCCCEICIGRASSDPSIYQDIHHLLGFSTITGSVLTAYISLAVPQN